MSKHRGGGQPEFSRLRTKAGVKQSLKRATSRRNRRALKQNPNPEVHQDRRPPTSWDES